MSGNAVHTSSTSGGLPVALLVGFAAGFIAVLVFHQGIISLMHTVGMLPNAPFRMQPTWPFGVPQVISLAFWGGIWGIVLAVVLRRVPQGAGWWIAAFAFGALAPTLFGRLVILPLRGVPMSAAWSLQGLSRGLVINGVWGLGTAVVLDLWRRHGAAALARGASKG